MEENQKISKVIAIALELLQTQKNSNEELDRFATLLETYINKMVDSIKTDISISNAF